MVLSYILTLEEYEFIVEDGILYEFLPTAKVLYIIISVLSRNIVIIFYADRSRSRRFAGYYRGVIYIFDIDVELIRDHTLVRVHSQILGMFPVELFVGEMLSTPVKTS